MVSLGHHQGLLILLNTGPKQKCQCTKCKTSKSGFHFITTAKNTEKYQVKCFTQETKDQLVKTHTSSCLTITSQGWIKFTCAIAQNLSCHCYGCTGKKESNHSKFQSATSSPSKTNSKSEVPHKEAPSEVDSPDKVFRVSEYNLSETSQDEIDLNAICREFSQVTISKTGNQIKITAQK